MNDQLRQAAEARIKHLRWIIAMLRERNDHLSREAADQLQQLIGDE